MAEPCPSAGPGILELCSQTGEYDDWAVLKSLILRRLEEVVVAYKGFESRRLELLRAGENFSEAATRATRAGLENCTTRVADINSLLNNIDRRCGIRALSSSFCLI